MLERAGTTCYWAKKVMGDLAHMGQLRDPERRRDLWEKGKLSLRSSLTGVAEDTKSIESLIEANVDVEVSEDGVKWVMSELPVGVMVFPDATRLNYRFANDGAFDGQYVASTTTTRGDKVEELVPGLGYKSSKGVWVDLEPREPDEWISQGGFYLDGKGGLAVLNYADLVNVWDEELNEGEVLMGADWYIDSNNQDDVCAMSWPGDRRFPFNAIGVLGFADGRQKLWAVNGARTSWLRQRSMMKWQGEMKVFPARREVAAMANVVARMEEADYWQLGGIEYNQGGTFDRDHATYVIGHAGFFEIKVNEVEGI